MNGFARDISMTSPIAGLLAALGAAGVCAFAGAASAQPCQASGGDSAGTAARSIEAEAERVATRPGPYPSFCDIPQTPTDIRPAEAWRVAVAETEGAGGAVQADAQVVRSEPIDTDRWAGEALQEATPPPAITTPSSTEDFARQMRDRATPPPRPR
jgi:hypothetical protein